MTQIAEYGSVDRARFANLRATARPFVLRDQIADWPAVAAARAGDEDIVAYLKRFATPAPVTTMVGAPEIGGRFHYSPDLTRMNFERGSIAVGTVLDRLLAERHAPEPAAFAIQSAAIPKTLPGFERDNAVALVDATVTPRIWIGNAITVATHHDPQENLACVVAGRRRFTLFPPDQVANLYPGPIDFTPAGAQVSMVDPHAPDLDRYPRFAAALGTAQTVELSPGDVLYIPFHWWHHVASLGTFNILVNYWWNDAVTAAPPKDALLHALAAIRDLPEDQRAAWRALFDHYVFDAEGTDHLPPHAHGVFGAPSPDRTARLTTMLRDILERY